MTTTRQMAPQSAIIFHVVDLAAAHVRALELLLRSWSRTLCRTEDLGL
jgi:hypothetical protein